MIQVSRMMTPGPAAALPAAIQAAMASQLPQVHHRSAEFRRMILDLREGMRGVLRSRGQTVVLTCSGTGAMEACVANALAPGDHALVVTGARFGDRWAAIARALGVEVTEFPVTAGQPVDPAELIAAITAGAEQFRAVIMCAVETSTGELLDPALVSETVKALPDCLLVVDGITWIGAHTADPDSLGIDMLVTASQKAFSAPPGLSMVTMSRDAIARAEANERGRYTLDLIRELEGQQDGITAFTPAVSTVAAVLASIRWIGSLPNGVGSLIHNAEVLAAACRRGLEALDCEVYPRTPANSLTVVRPPLGLTSSDIVRNLRASYGWQISDGQGKLKGRVMRIGHMGHTDVGDLLGLIGAIELVLVQMGVAVKPGRGLQAAQEVIAHRQRLDMSGDGK